MRRLEHVPEKWSHFSDKNMLQINKLGAKSDSIRSDFALAVAILLAVAGVSPAAAQIPDCAAAKSQADLTACADREYHKSDAALNQAYARLKAKFPDPKVQETLVAAERAWIAYRDRECEFETGGTADGTIHPMLLALCLNEKTLVHTAEVTRQLNCQEGDPSCVH